MFLDEPTNGLDPSGMAKLRDLIRELGTSERTVILSSHLLYEVEQVCDSVAILSRGRLIAQGRVQDLLRQQSIIKLKTTNDEQARDVLASLDWIDSVNAKNGYLMAEAPPDRSGELTKALAQREVFVTEMAPLRVSLEDFFLEVTEGNETVVDNGELV